MSDEYQWRQLGSAVNAVLLNAKTKAIRSGHIVEAPCPNPPARKTQMAPFAQARRDAICGLGFLSAEAPASKASPAQLELPFGLETQQAAQSFGAARAPRRLRLM